MPAQKRLLIIEEEALIALDIQQVVEESLGLRATAMRDYEEAGGLIGRLADFVLAIVTPPRSLSDRAFAQALVDAGVAVVVCSAAMTNLSRSPLATSPTVNKPFTDVELAAACRAAMAGKPIS